MVTTALMAREANHPNHSSATIADILRELLEQYRTQLDLAEQAGISGGTIYKLERGARPSEDMAAQIADRLQFSPELRRRWFRACRYIDPQEETWYEPVLEGATVQALDGARELTAEQRTALNEEVRKLIERHQRRRGVE